jgi:hypothetical protein
MHMDPPPRPCSPIHLQHRQRKEDKTPGCGKQASSQLRVRPRCLVDHPRCRGSCVLLCTSVFEHGAEVYLQQQGAHHHLTPNQSHFTKCGRGWQALAVHGLPCSP